MLKTQTNSYDRSRGPEFSLPSRNSVLHLTSEKYSLFSNVSDLFQVLSSSPNLPDFYKRNVGGCDKRRKKIRTIVKRF